MMSSTVNNNNNNNPDPVKPKVEILKNEDKLMALINDRNNQQIIRGNKNQALVHPVGSKSGNIKEKESKSGYFKEQEAKSGIFKEQQAKSGNIKEQEAKSRNFREQQAKSGNFKEQEAKSHNFREQGAKSGNFKEQEANSRNFREQEAKSGNFKEQEAKSDNFREQQAKSSTLKEHDIYVGNLSLNTTKESLYKFMSRFGRVEQTKIMYYPDTYISRRFGFVTFTDSQATTDKILSCKNLILDGMMIQIEPAHKRNDRGAKPQGQENRDGVKYHEFRTGPGTEIFVGGIGKDITLENLLDHFSKFGTVVDCKLPQHESPGYHRGFAFMTFSSSDEAQNASRERYQQLGKKIVDVKIAAPRNRFQGTFRDVNVNSEPVASCGPTFTDKNRSFASLTDPLVLPMSFIESGSFSGHMGNYPSHPYMQQMVTAPGQFTGLSNFFNYSAQQVYHSPPHQTYPVQAQQDYPTNPHQVYPAYAKEY